MKELADIIRSYIVLSLSFCALALVALASVAFAQSSLPVGPASDLTTSDALQQLLTAIGGLKGASALGVAVVITQGVMLFFRTPLSDFAGKWKLVIAAGVGIVSSVLGLMLGGMPFLAALINGATLAAIQTFAHQAVTQFTTKA